MAHLRPQRAHALTANMGKVRAGRHRCRKSPPRTQRLLARKPSGEVEGAGIAHSTMNDADGGRACSRATVGTSTSTFEASRTGRGWPRLGAASSSAPRSHLASPHDGPPTQLGGGGVGGERGGSAQPRRVPCQADRRMGAAPRLRQPHAPSCRRLPRSAPRVAAGRSRAAADRGRGVLPPREQGGGRVATQHGGDAAHVLRRRPVRR